MIGVTIGVVMFLIWVYRELRQEAVLGTYTAAGYSPGPFWAAPLCGTTLALGIGVLFVFLMHGDEQRAIALATAKTGSGIRVPLLRNAPQLHRQSGRSRGAGVRRSVDRDGASEVVRHRLNGSKEHAPIVLRGLCE
jgi:hypothetical protein